MTQARDMRGVPHAPKRSVPSEVPGGARRFGQVVLDSNGDATVTFSPPLTLGRAPFIVLTPMSDSANNPVVVNVNDGSFVTNADGDYESFVIRGGRLRNLPSVLALLSDLAGYLICVPSDAAGTKVSWLAF